MVHPLQVDFMTFWPHWSSDADGLRDGAVEGEGRNGVALRETRSASVPSSITTSRKEAQTAHFTGLKDVEI